MTLAVEGVLTFIGVIILLAVIMSIILKKIGLNPLLGYIISGFVLGPFAIGLLKPGSELMAVFGELGLFVLLFYLGIELSLKSFLKSGSSTFGLAMLDMIALAGCGFVIIYLFGFSVMFAAIVGLMMFSNSTAIISKFLIDKKLVQDPPSRIALTILIIQDFLGIMLLVFVTTLSKPGAALQLGLLAIIFSVAAFYAIHRISKIVQKWLYENGFGDTEVTLYGMGLGLLVAALGGLIGVSTTIGAYFGGFALSETQAGNKIKHELNFLRDFFLVFFFVSFGATLFYNPELGTVVFPDISTLIFLGAMVLALVIMLVVMNFLVFGFFGGQFGLSKEDSSQAAVLLTPLGEFVIIIATVAVVALKGTEAALLSPVAFMLILATIILFYPLYSQKEKYVKLMARLPLLPEYHVKKTKIIPMDLHSENQFKKLLLNLFIIICLAVVGIMLYKQIPNLGVPIPFSREATSILLFVFIAIIPALNVVKAIKSIQNDLKKKLFTHKRS